MTESELYQKKIKPLLLQNGFQIFRLENPKFPDIYSFKENRSLWIELKVINSIQKIIKPSWRIGQLSWMKRINFVCDKNYCIAILCLWYLNKFYFLKPKETYSKKELLESIKEEKFYGINRSNVSKSS